jgi:basic membrane protein A
MVRVPLGGRIVSLLVALAALFGALAMTVRADAQQVRRAQVVMVAEGCAPANFDCVQFARALRRSGVSARIISPDVREDLVGTLSLLARQDYALIIVSVCCIDALSVVAAKYPKARFAILDTPLDAIRGRPRNVEAIVNQPNEAAYLAGWLAARLERLRPGKDVLGVVGGVSIPSVDDFVFGFRAGARAADPGITVYTDYSNDFVDPTKCEVIARSQIERGAGAVFNVAGACGLGTLRAAKAAGVWGIGVDVDQSFLGPHILTSVTKGYEAGYAELLRQVRAGKIRAGRTTVLTMRDGGAGLGRISPKVPTALRAQLARVRQRLLSGQIRVPVAPRS